MRRRPQRGGSVRHDLGDAEQDDEGEEKQVDIGLDLAGVAERGDIADDLLTRGRRIRSFAQGRRQAPRLPSSRSMR